MVLIFDHSATHPAGIIGEDTAHHAGINGSRIWSDAATIHLEHVVDESANDTRLEADEPADLFHLVFSPMLGNIHQNPVRHRLTGKTRPGGAKGHRDFVLLCECE